MRPTLQAPTKPRPAILILLVHDPQLILNLLELVLLLQQDPRVDVPKAAVYHEVVVAVEEGGEAGEAVGCFFDWGEDGLEWRDGGEG